MRPDRFRSRGTSPSLDFTDVDDEDFEGTLVLEQLAAIDKVDDFFEAVDADDVERATRLMKRANVDLPTIAIVIKKMETADGEH